MYSHGLQKWGPLNGRLGLRTVEWLQTKVRGRGLGLRPRLFDGSVCDDGAAESEYAAAVCLHKRTFY